MIQDKTIIKIINNREGCMLYHYHICYLLILNLLFISHDGNIGVDLNNNNNNKLEQKTNSTQTWLTLDKIVTGIKKYNKINKMNCISFI